MKLINLAALAGCFLVCGLVQAGSIASKSSSPGETRARQFNSVEAYLSRMGKQRDQPAGGENNGDKSSNGEQSKGRSFINPLDGAYRLEPVKFDYPTRYSGDSFLSWSRSNGYSNRYSSSYDSQYEHDDQYESPKSTVPYEVFVLRDPEVRVVKTSKVNSQKPGYTPFRTVLTFGSADRDFTSIGHRVYEPELIIQEESIRRPKSKSKSTKKPAKEELDIDLDKVVKKDIELQKLFESKKDTKKEAKSSAHDEPRDTKKSVESIDTSSGQTSEAPVDSAKDDLDVKQVLKSTLDDLGGDKSVAS